ncbi:MAG TPA: protein kinase [Kofleriaceae bacterium]|nr:protein kinase [Kofleriaceae bacterium]
MTRSGPPPDQFPRKFGKYHLLAPLAQGGMGALYLAVTGERGLEKLLVIKTVLPHLADSEYLARFRDEAKVVVKLSHGNLIPVFDAGQVDGELFLAMDFVEGKDLRAVWNRCAHKGVAFPVDVAVFLVKELCRGLGYAHSFGDLRLVHRDVSPPNVLISYSGEVKLTDFGLASSTLKLEKTAPGIIYGKVSYMSPEQARGEPLDGRSDLYAAGIILWELLTGRQLFPPGKEQPQDLLKRARNPVAVPPSQRAPRVPPALDAICIKALAANREDRFATGEELRDALGGWLAAESPATDAARIERFLHMLFAEDIERERVERQALIEKTRERVRATMPPTDELRRILERGGSPSEMAAAVAAADRRKEAGPNMGRRAPDVGEPHSDRRQQQGRRMIDKVLVPSGGVAVDVPAPGPGGRTVVPGESGAAAAAAADFEPSAETRRTDFLNEVIDGRYRIDELIGEGGMGRVYLAEHVEIGKRVAIKILHPVYGRMPDLVERFRREARAASKIGHPHIVDVTDSGTTVDGSVYFVMEYLEGVELASVIDREGALDVARALRITTQICRALAAAHAVGIIHRDLKPENVFLTVREGAADFVKVLDFGIAKSSEAEEARGKRLTHPGMAMGTPEYMSPEQAAGRPADERCDVYAVGAILYEMLTGAPPYDGDNFMEILTKKATVDPAPPSALRPEIPPMVEVLVTSAMARDPEKRPPSMEAFEYEVTKALSGRGAAVAKILGIQSEAALLANLGSPYMPRDEVTPVSAPGMAQAWRARMASGQMGARMHEITPQPTLSSHGAVGGSNATHGPAVAVPAMAIDSGPSMVSGPNMSPLMGSSPGVGMVMPTPAYTPEEVSESTELIRKGGPVPDVRGAGMRLFGWVILILLLVAGGGAVFLALDSERSGAGKPAPTGPAPAATPEPGATGAATPAGEPSPQADDKRAKPVERGKDKGGSSGDGKSARSSKDDGKAAITDDLVPRTAKEAEALLKEASSLRDKLRWDAAREKYELVVAGKFKRDQGYLGLAEVAFQHNRADDVIAYARRAGTGVRARILLGHAHFKKKDYAAALKYYESVLKEEKGNVEAQNGAKAARDKLR